MRPVMVEMGVVVHRHRDRRCGKPPFHERLGVVIGVVQVPSNTLGPAQRSRLRFWLQESSALVHDADFDFEQRHTDRTRLAQARQKRHAGQRAEFQEHRLSGQNGAPNAAYESAHDIAGVARPRHDESAAWRHAQPGGSRRCRPGLLDAWINWRRTMSATQSLMVRRRARRKALADDPRPASTGHGRARLQAMSVEHRRRVQVTVTRSDLVMLLAARASRSGGAASSARASGGPRSGREEG